MIRTSKRPASIPQAWPLALGVLALASLSSCDNPACVFSAGGCQVLPGGGANALSSTFPATGERNNPGGPSITQIFPSGFTHPASPLVLVFSESVSPASVKDAFQLRNTSGLGNDSQPNEALIGDGRVLILIPPPLVPGQEYELFYSEEAEIRDLSGARAALSPGGVVGTFTIDPEPGDLPKLLMSWPPSGSTGASTIGEIVTVFDRPIQLTTISGLSWTVELDGLPPTVDALPSALLINGGIGTGGQTVPDSRVWSWSAVDPATDSRVPLGEGVTVTVALSTGASITTPLVSGEGVFSMAPTTVSFTTAGFSPPSSLAITSSPPHAIGIANLTQINGFEIEVGFDSAASAGDVLEIFLVGNNPDASGSGIGIISRQRTVPLSEGTASTFVLEPVLQLVAGNAPLAAIFADGDVGIGFALIRGGVRSAMRVLDVDLDTPGIQDPALDLQAPTMLSLFGQSAGDTQFYSDLLEFSVAGVASEKPASAEVTVNIGGTDFSNRLSPSDPPPPVTTSSANGVFVARPVAVGQLAENTPANFSVIVYDRALNASNALFMSYVQRGGSGPGPALAGGDNVEVVVFNAVTLKPISGARVFGHGYVGGVEAGLAQAPVVTGADGHATVPSAPDGVPVFTVQANGYDYFSFQGIPTNRLEIPLTPQAPWLVSLAAGVSSSGSVFSLPHNNSFVADSRLLMPSDPVLEAQTCFYDTLLDRTLCSFDPTTIIRGGEIGLVTALATKNPDEAGNLGAFSAPSFLQAFELSYPRLPVTQAPPIDPVQLTIGSLLSGPEVDPADIPRGTPDQVFNEPPNFATDFANIVGDPLVSVEVFTNGLRGMMTVGLGRAYVDAANLRWDIRAAYSARAKDGGEFAQQQIIEDDRLLRVEIVDAGGNRTGARQPLSSATGIMSSPEVPGLISPLGTGTGGPAYDLTYENVLVGSMDTKGLYRALLVDVTGKRWHLWTLDPDAASGDVVTHVPPVGTSAGGASLAAGQITCFLDVWGYAAFDPTGFLFSDIPRRHNHFASGAPKFFTQEP